MSSTYYEYRSALVKIAHRLMALDGWTVYGYHADESDAMTDYYSPAYWGGIAEKNGYILVVNQSRGAEEYRRQYTVYSEEAPDVAEKIAKLEKMTQARGASAQEEATARAAIEKLKAKKTAGAITKEDYRPGYKANPPRCNWHIEKNGIIIDKGSGLLKFSGVVDTTNSWEAENWQKFNNLTREEWIKDYTSRPQYGRYYTEEQAEYYYKRAEETYKLLNDFNKLIARFNNTAGGMVGNEDESGYTYAAKKVTKYKTVYKFKAADSGSFKAGQCFQLLHSFTYNRNRGTVYRLEETSTGTLAARRVSLKSNKSLTGSATASNFFGYYAADGSEESRGRDKEKFLNWITAGAITWGSVEAVQEPYEVEIFIKVDANGNEYKPQTAPASKKEATAGETTTAETPEASETKTTDYTIKADTDTRDGSQLYVVTLNNRVDAETFSRIREEMKSAGGYYSKFKKGFIFREDPAAKLTKEATAEATQEEAAEAEATAAASAETAPEASEATAEAEAAPEASEAAQEEPERRESTPEELQRIFGNFWQDITNGRKLYTAANGNIYDDKNNLFYINTEPAKNPETIAACRDEKPGESVKEPAADQEAQNDAQNAGSIQSEETPAADEKTQEEPKKAPGYTGPASDLLTAEEVEKLTHGEQVKKGGQYDTRAYFTTPYTAGVLFLYSLYADKAGNITPDQRADFTGFIYNGALYTDFKAITREASEDINAAIIEAIPTEEAAERNAAGLLSEYETGTADAIRQADYSQEALRHFLDGTRPELYLYMHAERLSAAAAIRYITEPAEVVKEHAAEYIKANRAEILTRYIRHNKTAAALEIVRKDPEAQKLKAIKEATADESKKTYNILLTNGQTVKAEARAVRRLPYSGTVSSWYVSSADREKLPRNEYGRAEDIKPADIVTITHGGRIIYKAA